MKITICTSSSETIDIKHISLAKKLLNYLVTLEDVELNWGSCSVSIMGECYDIFKQHNKKINGFTTKKYVGDIINLPNAKHKILDTTFDLKKEMFNTADIIICIAGGLGTISEFFSYLEEIRSNDINKTLILYNEDEHFNKTLELIDDIVKRNFNKPNIYNFFKVARNLDEIKEILK